MHILARLGIIKFIVIATIFLHGALDSYAVHAQSTTVVLSEFMALNESTLADEDGEYSDWIELHNAGNAAVNLQGYALTDSNIQLNKWVFPNVVLGPNQYLVVFASNKNRTIAGQELHTNFKLSAGGEYLALSDAAGNVLSEYGPTYPQQYADQSFGFNSGSDGSAPTGYNFDFGTETSPVQAGWSRIASNTNNSTVSWSGAGRSSVDRGAAAGVNNVNRDLVYGSGISTLNVNVPNGIWTVVMNMGDTCCIHDAMRVKAEGELIYDNITAQAGEFVYVGRGGAGTSRNFDVDVTDGQLNIEFSDAGGSDVNWVITRLSIKTALRYFDSATPGSGNIGGFFPYNAAPPQASLARGFYSTPQSVTLSSAVASTIRYTLDGSEPSTTNGSVYNGPLTIDQTTTLRVAGIDSLGQSSSVETFTYIFVDDVLNQSTPVGWPTTNVNDQHLDYGMDPDVVSGQNNAVKQSLLSLPSISIVTDVDRLFDPATGIYVNAKRKGDEWKRPTSVEWLNADNTPGFQIDAGLRIRGGGSRIQNNPKHSFRLFFSGDYDGTLTTLTYPIFGTEGVDTFKKLDLRTSQNYNWAHFRDVRNTYLREVWSRDTQGAMGNPYTRSNYVHLYINGHYWGLFMTQERVSEEYAQDYFGGNEDDYDVVKHSDVRWETDLDVRALHGQYKATSGEDTNWRELWALTQDQLVSDAEFEQIEAVVDLDGFIDNMLLHFYTGDLDATISNFNGNRFANNWYALRDRTGNGTKWQFFAHDAEHTLGVRLRDINTNRVGPFPVLDENELYMREYFNPQWLHQALVSNAKYRSRFQYRAWQHMMTPDGALTPAKGRERWDIRKAQVGPAILAESARWGDAKRAIPLGLEEWQTEVDWVETNWFSARTAIVMDQLRAQNLATNSAPPAPATPVPPTPKMVLNEYNAVDGSAILQDAGSDAYFGTIQGNGGDWFELVTVVDNLDIRGWTLEIWDADNFSGISYRTDILQFANQPLLSDLRRGTILTIAEDVADDVSYNPFFGDWWINLQSNSNGDGAYFTAETQSNFDTNSKAWQLVIRDAAGNLVLAPVGEGVGTMAAGVGNQEVGKLEEDPSVSVTVNSAYNDGVFSTFGAPNLWAAGASSQDFTTLRSVVAQRFYGDVNCDSQVNVIDALYIMQYEVQMRSSYSDCPLSNTETQIYSAAGDVSDDNNVNVIDALFIMQCEVGISNPFCSE